MVVAYGRIIPPWMLALPRLGCINLHASLLPKYRGAAPIQWAVAMGDAFTGNTTMLLEEGLDTGPILLQQTIEIGPDQTAAELFPVLAEAGAPLVVETLAGLAEWNDPSRSRRTTRAPRLLRCSTAKTGGWILPRARRTRTLQPLARISALARRVHCAQREEADRASHGGCASELRRGTAASPSRAGFWSRWPPVGGMRRRIHGWNCSKCSSKARSA